MAKKLSTSEKVRRMIEQGHTNKAIVDRLGVKPQIVYNLRYQMNKARGLGALGASKPAPKVQRPKVKAGTGITAPGAIIEVPAAPTMPITLIDVEPMWKVRVKNFLRALGWRG